MPLTWGVSRTVPSTSATSSAKASVAVFSTPE